MLHFPSSKLVSDNKGITWIPKSLKVFASFGKTAAIPSITTPSGASSPSAQYQGGLRNEYSSKCGCSSHPRVSEAHDLWRLPRINRLHFQISAQQRQEHIICVFLRPVDVLCVQILQAVVVEAYFPPPCFLDLKSANIRARIKRLRPMRLTVYNASRIFSSKKIRPPQTRQNSKPSSPKTSATSRTVTSVAKAAKTSLSLSCHGGLDTASIKRISRGRGALRTRTKPRRSSLKAFDS